MPSDKKKNLPSQTKKRNWSVQSRINHGKENQEVRDKANTNLQNLDNALKTRTLRDQMPTMGSFFSPTRLSSTNQPMTLPEITVTAQKNITPSVSTTPEKTISTPKATKKAGPDKNSVVDTFKAKGFDSSFENRAKVAKGFGMDNYKGTASENMSLTKKINRIDSQSVKRQNISTESKARSFNKVEIPSSQPKAKKGNFFQRLTKRK
jgi:hypothetical protein